MLIFDLLYLLWSVAIGLAIGIALLPWCKKIGGGREFPFLRAYALFWPFILANYFWRGVKAYIKAWRKYLHSRRSEKLKMQSKGEQ